MLTHLYTLPGFLYFTMSTSHCTSLSCCTVHWTTTLQTPVQQVSCRSIEKRSPIPAWSHKDTFFISYWSRNIFITLSGVSGRAQSVERRAEGERGHVEPDRDTGMTLWHVKIPSTELCLAQQHETRKWATNVSPDPPSYSNVHTHTHTHAQTCKHNKNSYKYKLIFSE